MGGILGLAGVLVWVGNGVRVLVSEGVGVTEGVSVGTRVQVGSAVRVCATALLTALTKASV